MTVTAAAAPARARPRLSRRWVTAACVALFALVVIGPIVADNSAQPASRIATTAALADHGTVDLTRYAHVLGVDKAIYDGRLRSDKAPGGPVLGVPFYILGRALGLQNADVLRVHKDLTLWWQTFWGSMVPFALLLGLMYEAARRIAPRRALWATGALGFGTLMLPHAVNLYGHCLAALFAYASWRLVERRGSCDRALVGAGVLGAAAIAVEYHTAIVFAVVGVYVIARWRRRITLFVAGAVPVFALVAWFQDAEFGRPWRLAYSYLGGKTDGSYGVPTVSQMIDLVAGKHGLLWTSPIVLVAMGACIVFVRQPAGRLRREARIATAVIVPYVILIAGWTGTAQLEQPGPRYLIPALPFAVVPLAAAWERVEGVAIATTLWGVLVMVAGSVTNHLIAVQALPYETYFGRVGGDHFNATLWSIGFGYAGAFLYAITVAVAGTLLWRAYKMEARR